MEWTEDGGNEDFYDFVAEITLCSSPCLSLSLSPLSPFNYIPLIFNLLMSSELFEYL